MNKRFSNIVLVIFLLLTLLPFVSECSNPELFKVKTAKVHLKILEVGIHHLSVDTGRVPTTEEGLLLLIEKPPLNSGWQGPYIKKGIPLDPWGKKYIYLSPSKDGNQQFSLYSSGKNTVDDQGEIDDITNWKGVNYKYYGNPSNKSDILLLSIGIIFIAIVFLVIKPGKPTITQIATRFTRLTLYFFILFVFAFITFPTFGSSITPGLLRPISFSILSGCIVFPFAGLICSALIIFKVGFTIKIVYKIMLNITPLALCIILYFLS